MNPSTNTAKKRLPLEQSPDPSISFHRKPHDNVETAEFNDRKGSWHWDVRTDTTVWSEPLYGIVGWENAKIPPFRAHSCFYTSESWIRLVDATLELLQTGTPYELRLQMLNTDGTRRWVIRNGEAVRNERGEILQLRGTVQDISEWMLQVETAERDWQIKSNPENAVSHLIRAQEEKNAKRASDLRDHICQRMALLAVNIQSFSSSIPNLSAEAQIQLESLWQETTGILAELHRVSDRLYPLVLDVLGLPLAIRSLCREFTKQHGVAIDYSCSDLPANHLDKQCRIVFYRVLEEILENVVRHSNAKSVMVGLDHDCAGLRLKVSENGCGFDRANAKSAAGPGFVRLKALIGQIGGRLTICSHQACGTLIEVRVPLTIQSNAINLLTNEYLNTETC